MRVEEKNYRGQGSYIVAYRAQVLSDGRVSVKSEKDAFHVRDIEKYYVDYTARVKERFAPVLDSVDLPLNSVGLPRSGSFQGLSIDKRTSDVTSTINQTSGDLRRTRSSTSRDSNFQALLTGETLPLFYGDTATSASESNRREMGEYLHTAAVCYLEPLDNFSLNQSIDADMYVEVALCGDAIVHHCLTTGVGVVPEDAEPNTIRQAYALPDRDKWRESVDVEMEMIRQFSVFSFPILLPRGTSSGNLINLDM